MDIKAIGVNMRNWVDSADDRDYWINNYSIKICGIRNFTQLLDDISPLLEFQLLYDIKSTPYKTFPEYAGPLIVSSIHFKLGLLTVHLPPGI